MSPLRAIMFNADFYPPCDQELVKWYASAIAHYISSVKFVGLQHCTTS